MVICCPLSACDWLQNEWPRMTLSGYFMSKSVFGQHFLIQSVWLSKIITWKVTSYATSGRNVGQWVTSFWEYKLFLDIRKRSWDYCHQTVVGSLKSTNLQFSRCYIFVSFGNNVDIVVRCDINPFWISTDNNKDDLKWPWMPGTLDIPVLWLSKPTICNVM